MFNKIFKEPTLLKSDQNLFFTPLTQYSFAKKASIVALAHNEVAIAGMDYPVLFSKESEGIIPVALLSALSDDNVFINTKGNWEKEYYIPYFLKMYPFIISPNEEFTQFQVVYDKSSKSISTDKGTIAFVKDAKLTEYGQNFVSLVQGQYSSFEKVKETLSTIDAMGLLEEVELKVPDYTKEKTYLVKGFYAVNAKKVDALSDKDLLKLVKMGGLTIINAQLLSMNNIQKISSRLK